MARLRAPSRRPPAVERGVMPTQAKESWLPSVPDQVPFQVESVLDFQGTVYVFARSLDPSSNWTLSANSRLGGRPILPQTQISRALDSTGSQRYDLFVFALRTREDRGHLRAGDHVFLEA